LGINEEGISCGRGRGGACVESSTAYLKSGPNSLVFFENLLLNCLFTLKCLVITASRSML
jgi:hypothetical protein